MKKERQRKKGFTPVKYKQCLFSGKARNFTGFTLVEMMVVVAIIGILFAVVIVSVNRARNRTRDAIIVSQLEQVQALAETVHNPDTEYKELYDMWQEREDPIGEINRKISEEMDRDFNLYFPEDSIEPETEGHYEYCSYVFLWSTPGQVFCVDSTGFAEKVDVDPDNEINCQARDWPPYNCEYRD